MSRIDFHTFVLPDIEMCGGDTQPWHVIMMHENGQSFTKADSVGYYSILTIMPFMYSSGLGVQEGSYVTRKQGTIQQLSDGRMAAVFTFATDETRSLTGKYTYQIEFYYGNDRRIGQGNLYIRNNIDR